MQKNFKRALAGVLVHEGGKSDHKLDPGGRTNQGVVQRVYNDYRKTTGQKPRDVYLMTTKERDDIYKRRYWDVIQGDKLPPGVDYVVFDGAVNSGPIQSGKWLQRALGHYYAGRIDGQIGMTTIEAVREHPNHDALVAAICDRRMAFLRSLKTWRTFGTGWTRRVNGVKATGQAWAMGTVGPPVEYIPGAEAKATIEDMRPLPAKAPGDAAAASGTVTAFMSQGIDQTKSQLESFAQFEWIQHVLLGLTVAGVAVAAGGFLYAWLSRKKSAELIDALDLNPNVARE